MPVADVPPHEQYVVDILLNCTPGSVVSKENKGDSTATPGGVSPCKPGEKGEPLAVPVLLSTLSSISLIRIHLQKDLRTLQAREMAWKSVLEVQKRFDEIPLLDPVKNMNIKDDKFKQLIKVRKLSPSVYVRLLNRMSVEN